MDTEIAIREVGPRIRLALSSLSEKEQQIARFCLSLGSAIQNLSIHDLASQQQVSAAMLVKLAHHLGFSGFKQFKHALSAYSQLSENNQHEELNPTDDTKTVVEKVFKTAINALLETLEIFDFASLEQAAKAMGAAKTIHMFGVGGSGAIALDFYHKLLRIGIVGHHSSDSHLMVMAASLLTPDRVLLAISHSGNTHAIVEALRLAKAQGATTILITNTPNSPSSKYSDILLCSVAQGSPITGEGAAARVVQLNILDALFVLIAQQSYQQSLTQLEKTINAVASLRA